jgi:preprotein translocase subunit SecE
MFERIKRFFAESQQELRHVNWPTRAEAMRLTGIVIGISLGLAVFLGSFDYLFPYIIRVFVVKS